MSARAIELVVLGLLISFASADALPIIIEPDDFPEGTDISNAFPGVTLRGRGHGDRLNSDRIIVRTPGTSDPPAPTGVRVFGFDSGPYSTMFYWSVPNAQWMEIEFHHGVNSVSVDFEPGLNGGFSEPRLRAYDATGTLVDEIARYLSTPGVRRYTLEAEGIRTVYLQVVDGRPGMYDNLAYVPAPPTTILSWRSVRIHESGLGIDVDLSIELDPAATGADIVCEPRRDGVQRIEVDFDGDASDCYAPGQVIVSGDLTVDNEALVNNGRTLRLDLLGSQDGTCYTIDLSASVVTCLVDDADCMVRVLAGNTNGDGQTNLIDVAFVKSKNGQDIVPDNIRFDVNVDGSINLIDVALVKSLNGGSVSCP